MAVAASVGIKSGNCPYCGKPIPIDSNVPAPGGTASKKIL